MPHFTDVIKRVTDDIPEGATGAWALSGNGFCLDCTPSLDDADFDAWDHDGDIVCANCDKDTGDFKVNGPLQKLSDFNHTVMDHAEVGTYTIIYSRWRKVDGNHYDGREMIEVTDEEVLADCGLEYGPDDRMGQTACGEPKITRTNGLIIVEQDWYHNC